VAYLNLSASSESRFEKAQTLNESFGGEKKYKIFLSYRHVDRKYVAKIVGFLNKLDTSIYVDYLDEELNISTNKTTAPTLRKRIEQSEKLIQLITPNSYNSKWMPWELGLGDGVLGYVNTIVLPAAIENSVNFDQDYLKMYGYIETGNSKDLTIRGWVVRYPTGEAIWFKDWLKK
jgi:hypothetical protein